MSWSANRRAPSAGWRRLRRVVMDRDNNLCQMRTDRCTVRATEIDHIVPVFEGGSDHPSNLLAVCYDCHLPKSIEERKRAAKRAREWTFREPAKHPGLL